MKLTRRIVALWILLVALVAATPALAEPKAPTPVMVYALAWDACYGTLGYQLEMSDSASYGKARTALNETIKKKFPNAKGTRAGSSKFDYSDKAGAVAVIEVDNSDRACKPVVMIHFGVDEAEALANAVKAAGKRPHRIREQRYFVKVTTAPATP